jgi:hypothetical protein
MVTEKDSNVAAVFKYLAKMAAFSRRTMILI